jgi:hypothetical protein
LINETILLRVEKGELFERLDSVIFVKINIVTFNDAEAAAVREYLMELACLDGWRAYGSSVKLIDRQSDSNVHVVEHKSLRAQGNLRAASALATAFRPEESRPDLLIFYGCCGSINKVTMPQAFLVRYVHYMALGNVAAADNGLERVTLKSKWLMPTATSAIPYTFNQFDSALIEPLSKRTGIQMALAIATEAVIKVAPTLAVSSQTGNDEWSYGEGLRYLVDRARGKFGELPVIIDMESEGIATFADQLDVQAQVLVLRVVTDALFDKERHNQAELMMEGRVYLKTLVDSVLHGTAHIVEPIVFSESLPPGGINVATVERPSGEGNYFDLVMESFRTTQPSWLFEREYRGDGRYDPSARKWRPKRSKSYSVATSFIKYCGSIGRAIDLVDLDGYGVGPMSRDNRPLASVLYWIGRYDSMKTVQKDDWAEQFSSAVWEARGRSDLGPLLLLAIDNLLDKALDDALRRRSVLSWPETWTTDEERVRSVNLLLSPYSILGDADETENSERRTWLESVARGCGTRMLEMVSSRTGNSEPEPEL